MLYHPRMALRSAVLSLLLLASGPAGAQACAVAAAQGEPVQLSGVDAHGDPTLADGRALRLVGIAPRQDEDEDKRFRAGVERWRGRALTLAPLGPADRWGRLPSRLFTDAEGGAALDINAALIAARAARAMAEPAFAPCGQAGPRAVKPASTTPADAGPREAAAIDGLDGHDIAALKAQAGRMVTLSGRIASVGERAQRTYLNLSRRRGEAASIVMSRRVWREMQGAGWTAARLNGRAVKAHGVLSGQDGLLLDLASASALDVID